ncbi:hypothetical protein ACFLRI_00670 [Bacteroidota bacterium]
MKKLILIYTISLLPLLGFSQKGIYFRFQGGPSFPMIDLSSELWNFDSKAGGFAKFGYHGSIDLSGYFTPNIGVAVTWMKNFHKVNTDAIHTKAFQPGIDSLVTIESSPWVINYMMIGPVFSVFLSEKWTFEGRLQIGKMNTNSPKIKLYVTNVNGSDSIFTRDYAYAEALQYNAGIGLKYNFNEDFYFTMMADFHVAQPVFTYKESINVPNNLGVLNTSFGIAYKF